MVRAPYSGAATLDWTKWLQLIKDYGPVVGILLILILQQSMWINRLLDRHEKAYTGEIERMHQQMNTLLTHVLGQQASSADSPSVKQMLKDAQALPAASPPEIPKDRGDSPK